MKVVAQEPRANAAFLRLPRSGNHHDLGLFGLGTRRRSEVAAGRRPVPPGLAGGHGRRARAGTRRRSRAGAYTGESSHGATKSIYGADPDGNEFEVMWMLPRDAWGEFEHTATVERLDLVAEVARWSGVRTAAELVPLDAA